MQAEVDDNQRGIGGGERLISIDDIKQARDSVSRMNSVWEPVGLGEFTQELHDSPYDEELGFDGAGIFTRRENVIWRMQYGGVAKAIFRTAAIAAEYMQYVSETAS